MLLQNPNNVFNKEALLLWNQEQEDMHEEMDHAKVCHYSLYIYRSVR